MGRIIFFFFIYLLNAFMFGWIDYLALPQASRKLTGALIGWSLLKGAITATAAIWLIVFRKKKQ